MTNPQRKKDEAPSKDWPTVFAKWLAKAKDGKPLHPQDFAQEMGLSVSYVHALRSGKVAPGAKLRLKIQERSGGRVRFDQW